MADLIPDHPFDAEAYWHDRERKKWVVIVDKTARARLATPRDLGCEPIPSTDQSNPCGVEP